MSNKDPLPLLQFMLNNSDWWGISNYEKVALEWEILQKNETDRQNKAKNSKQVGLSWAKLSYQLGFGCSLIKICCILLINIHTSMTATNNYFPMSDYYPLPQLLHLSHIPSHLLLLPTTGLNHPQNIPFLNYCTYPTIPSHLILLPTTHKTFTSYPHAIYWLYLVNFKLWYY